MQLRNKYTELTGLKEEGVLIKKEEGVLIEGHEEIYSSWRFMGLQLEGFVLRPLYFRTIHQFNCGFDMKLKVEVLLVLNADAQIFF